MRYVWRLVAEFQFAEFVHEFLLDAEKATLCQDADDLGVQVGDDVDIRGICAALRPANTVECEITSKKAYNRFFAQRKQFGMKIYRKFLLRNKRSFRPLKLTSSGFTSFRKITSRLYVLSKIKSKTVGFRRHRDSSAVTSRTS